MDAGPDTVTCYRHPNREAPLRCTRCERPICLDDAVDAPVGFLCPDDAEQAPRVRKAHARAAGAAGAPVTRGLVATLVVVYVAQQVVPGLTQEGLTFGPSIADGEWWRIITGGFLHGGLLHIGFNGYLLWQLGQLLEPAMGRARFLGLYAAGLAGGSLGVLAVSWTSPTLGASGAVFGLMGAAMVLMRQRGIDVWRTSIGTLVLLNLGLTFAFRGISLGGHVGGLLAGAAAGWLLTRPELRERATAAQWVLAGALFAGALWFGTSGVTASISL